MSKEKNYLQGKLGRVKRVAANNRIPVCEDIQKIEEGREGKAKELFQILWERTLIQGMVLNAFRNYTLRGEKTNLAKFTFNIAFLALHHHAQILRDRKQLSKP